MKNRFLYSANTGKPADMTAFIICGAFFACGVAAGSVSARYAAESSYTMINDKLWGYIEAAASGQTAYPDFFRVLSGSVIPDLLVVFLGFSMLGFCFLPILAAIRGFLLSFSAAAVIYIFGNKGWALLVATYGIEVLVAIPCFFVLTVQALKLSASICKTLVSGSGRFTEYMAESAYFRVNGTCMAVLFVTVIVEVLLVPYGVSLAASWIHS